MTVGELWLLMGVKVDEGAVGKANRVLDGLRSRAKALMSLRAVESVFGLVQQVTDSATHLISYSHAMGMTVEQTQEWGYVAEQSGSNLKELSTGMNMFIRNVDEFRKGRGGHAMRGIFGELGIDQKAANNIMSGSKGLNEELLKMSDRIKKTGASSKTLEATFTRAFGVKAGKAMLADLARGREGIEALMARRKAMGELDEKQAETLRDLGNHLKDVKTQFGAIAAQIVAKLAPGLLKMVDAALAWMAANKDLISGALAAAIAVVAEAFSAVGTVITWVQGLFEDAFDGDTGAQAMLIGLAAIILAVVVPALWAMAAPIIIAVAPFLAIGAAVALIAYGVLQIAKHWDEIVDAVSGAVSYITDLWNSFWGWFSDTWDDVVGAVSDAWTKVTDGIKSAFEDAFEFIRRLPVVEQMFDLIEDIQDLVGGKAQGSKEERANLEGPTGVMGLGTFRPQSPTTNVAGGGGRRAAPDIGHGGISIGPTTINNYGVKDAAHASKSIGENIDQRLRHGAAALNPGGR